ncbi:MAG: hypothetical protein JXB14_06180 [Candidatus Altiarchaeota archaeon]|nr:hypothetical protein [Candidatus Altiarchaeota archaeon]
MDHKVVIILVIIVAVIVLLLFVLPQPTPEPKSFPNPKILKGDESAMIKISDELSYWGFTDLVPVNWSCISSTGQVTITFTNTGKNNISGLVLSGESQTHCNPDVLSPGESTVCVKDSDRRCLEASPGSEFELVIITYYDPGDYSASGMSNGMLYGIAE